MIVELIYKRPGKFIVLLAVMIAGAVFYSQFSLTHDASWYLVSTRMFLDGAILYEEIIEINPPLAFYLTIPALILSDFTNINPTISYFLYVIVLGGLCTGWTIRVVSQTALDTKGQAVFFFGALVANFILPFSDFGQREHLLLLFALPYIYYLILYDDLVDIAATEKITLGLVAFLGLGLKPYFLAIPLGIVVIRLIRNRKISELFNLANIALGILLLLYVLFIMLAHPLYLDVIIPIATKVYSGYGTLPLGVFLKSEFFAIPCLVIILAWGGQKLDNITIGLLGASAGALIAYFVQFKGWNYQLIPSSFFVFMTVVWCIYSRFEYLRKNVLLGILALAVIQFTLGHQLSRGPYQSRSSEAFAKYVRHPGEKILVLSTNVSAAFPFINDVNGQWSSRFPAQWLIPGAISKLKRLDCNANRKQCSELEDILDQARSFIADDMAKHQPTLVFVDHRKSKSYFDGIYFDYVDFMNRDKTFTKTWLRYSLKGTVDNYQVWVRDVD